MRWCFLVRATAICRVGAWQLTALILWSLCLSTVRTTPVSAVFAVFSCRWFRRHSWFFCFDLLWFIWFAAFLARAFGFCNSPNETLKVNKREITSDVVLATSPLGRNACWWFRWTTFLVVAFCRSFLVPTTAKQRFITMTARATPIFRTYNNYQMELLQKKIYLLNINTKCSRHSIRATAVSRFLAGFRSWTAFIEGTFSSMNIIPTATVSARFALQDFPSLAHSLFLLKYFGDMGCGPG